MRPIDADDAKRTYTSDMFDTEEDFERVNDVLDYAPTVDAVVVTRCKDCKYLVNLLTRRLTLKVFSSVTSAIWRLHRMIFAATASRGRGNAWANILLRAKNENLKRRQS